MGYKITDINILRIKDKPGSKKHEPDTESNHPFVPYDREDISKPKKALVLVLILVAIVSLIVWSVNAKASIIIESQQAYIEVENLPIKNAIEIPLSYTYSTTTKVQSYKTDNLKASGQVTFYNEFSTTAQPLNINTKIQTKAGSVYKTRSAISVPGYKKVNGKIVAGTVSVTVDADKAGPNYNVPSGQQLTVSAYKGTTRGTKLYAKSGGITGGATTKSPVFSDKVTKSVEEIAKDVSVDIFEQSLADARKEPGILITYSSSTLTSKVINACCTKDGVGTTTVTIAGVAQRINEQSVLISLVEKYKLKIKEQMSDSAYISPDALGVDGFASSTDITTVDGVPTIVKATIHVYTKLNSEMIKEYLKGTNVQSALNLIQTNSHSRSEIFITPFWIREIPTNIQNINIEFKR